MLLLLLLSSSEKPHSKTHFGAMLGLQPSTALISSKKWKVSRLFPLRELWSFTLLYLSSRYFIHALHCAPVRKVEIPCSFKTPLSFFAMESQTARFLLLLIGKLSLHNSYRRRVSALDQFGHRFLLDPGCDISPIELLSLLPSGLVAGDTCGRCGINYSGD